MASTDRPARNGTTAPALGLSSGRARTAILRPPAAVIAVIGGLLTALAWAFATLTSARASRRIGGSSTMAWVSLIGLAMSAPLLVFDRLPGPDDTDDVAWVAVSGLLYGVGLLLLYGAYARGRVSVISPISSTEGAIAALIAILAGEAASSGLLLVALAVIAVGVTLTTLEPGTHVADFIVGGGAYVLLAMGSALSFGFSLFAAGHASASVPLAWVVISGRIVGVVGVALPLLVLGRLRFERSVLPFMVIAAALEVVGFLTYAWGTTDDIAVTAVMSSQFAVIVAVVSHRLGDRLGPSRWLGVGLVATGVATVTLLRL